MNGYISVRYLFINIYVLDIYVLDIDLLDIYLTSFFSNLLVYSCQKILTIFVLFYCMDSRFYQRIMQNYGFF